MQVSLDVRRLAALQRMVCSSATALVAAVWAHTHARSDVAVRHHVAILALAGYPRRVTLAHVLTPRIIGSPLPAQPSIAK